jgi:hypothetical protein
MEIIYFGGFILAAFLWLFCVLLAYQTAPKRGRRAGVWALLTVVFGPLALFALYLMKPMHEPGHGGSQEKQGQHHDPRADLYEVPKKH